MIGICRYGHNRMVSGNYGLNYRNVKELIDCGLISSNDHNIHINTGQPDNKYDYLKIGDQVLVISSEEPISSYYNVHGYTKAGNELHQLVVKEAKLSIPFLVDFTEAMRDEKMRTQYARFIGQASDGSFTYEEPLVEIAKASE